MQRSKKLFDSHRVEFKVLIALSSCFLTFMAILHYSNNEVFHRFFGNVSPWLISFATIITGLIASTYLLVQKWFAIYRKITLNTFLRYSVVVVFTVTVAVMVDWAIVFPANMNILFPESLLFYPAIAFMVEILFHVVPLAVILFVASLFFKNTAHSTLARGTIFFVAMLEPTYQVIMDSYPIWAIITVWLNLYVFNLVQLMVFKVKGFIFMYAMRLVYYLLWHIIWGTLRLDLLFNI